MTNGRAEDARRHPRFDLFESKLHPPPTRAAIVPRTRLVGRLVATRDVPITSVVAPAGYGKTTLLAEWAERDQARFAWLSIDQHDNDPELLLSYTAAALDRVEPIDPELLLPSGRRGSPAAAASRVARAMSSMTEPVVLVFDHVELLHNDECLDTIAELALHLPPGSRLAMATRGEPPLPMPRLRAGGDITEVATSDLAMDASEARALLEAAGVVAGDAELAKLIERTEGWPVGLYLAALALRAGGSEQNAGTPFSGDDRLVAEYLRSEVLVGLSDVEVTFLTRTAVLDRMTGHLCDALIGDSGSAEILESLARSNLLVVALDRHGGWYRYHHLFRDLLRSELQRREPGLVPELHLRAADWYSANGMADVAIEHAQAGGDPDRVCGLLLFAAQPAFAAGRAVTVRRWMSWFEDEGLVEQYPAAAILGAVLFSRTGDAGSVERWAAAAEHSLRDGLVPEGSMLEAWLALLRALLCRNGVDEMRRDAERAVDGLPPGSGIRAAAVLAHAVSHVLEGDLDRAEPLLGRAIDVATHAGAIPAAMAALSEQAFVARDRQNWPEYERSAAEALSLVQTWHLDDYADSALAYAVSAGAALHRGDVGATHECLTNAGRLRPLLTYVSPFWSVQALLEMTRVYIGLADMAGAREALRHARDILRQRPDLGVLPTQADELQAKLDTMRSGRVGASSLTTAELRLVPYLPTHLTFPKIAERLFLSRNTIKSQAYSIYQKLGASSRGEAIERLRQVGLLDG